MKRQRYVLGVLALASLLLAGCELISLIPNSPMPAVTATQTPMHTPIPTATGMPTPTSTLTSSPTPSRLGGGRGQIAFFSDRDGNAEIYVMNADGTDQTRLTNNSAFDWDPDWSPDGTRIAFYSNRDGNPEICVMNADGTDQTRLTYNSADDGDPAWRP